VKSFCRGPAGWRSAHRPVEPTSGDVVRASGAYPSAKVIAVKFGSWRAACRELGWRALQPGSDEDLLDVLRSVAAELGGRFRSTEYEPIAAARGCPRPARSFGGSARGMLGCEPPGSSLGRLSGGHRRGRLTRSARSSETWDGHRPCTERDHQPLRLLEPGSQEAALPTVPEIRTTAQKRRR